LKRGCRWDIRIYRVKKVREGWREFYYKELQAYFSQIFGWVIEPRRIRWENKTA